MISINNKNFDTSLYLITDSAYLDEKTFLQKIEEACKGGVSLVQLREKTKSDRDCLELGFKVKEITDKYKIPLIIDDRLDLAMILDCGVHLGQTDIPISYARKLLGEEKIIGATSKTLEQALLAESQGADYLGVGAIFETTTKVKTVITSLDTLDCICQNVNIPVLAIGGLNIDNYKVLEGINISGICVVSAIMKSNNPKKDSQDLKKAIENMLK